MGARLWLAAVLSTLLAMAMGQEARAHEVQPGILDIRTERGQAHLEVEVTPEALLAGIDLDGLGDTDAAPEGADYDALRALEPAEIGARMEAFVPTLLANITLQIDGVAVPLAYVALRIDDPGNIELARRAVVSLTADLPDGAREAQIGWARAYGALIVRQDAAVAAPFTAILQSGALSDPFALQGGSGAGGWPVLGEYIPLGFEQIVPKGLDHILFVLTFFLLTPRLWPLGGQLAAFAFALTIALVSGALGWVTLPANLVDLLVAVSIVYVAVETLFTDRLSRWRILAIFGFGLVHGVSLAGDLDVFGLPEGQFAPALVGFTIGVEVALLAVLAVAVLAVGLWVQGKPWYRRMIAVPASSAIAAVGALWVIERVLLIV